MPILLLYSLFSPANREKKWMRSYPRGEKFNLWISWIHSVYQGHRQIKHSDISAELTKRQIKHPTAGESNSAEIMLQLPADSDNTDPSWRLSPNCWIPEESVAFSWAGWWEERGTFLHSQFVIKAPRTTREGMQIICLVASCGAFQKNILERVFNYYFNKLPNHPCHQQPILKFRITEWFVLEGH